MRSFTRDPSITQQRLKPGTVRRIASYARPYRVHLALFLVVPRWTRWSRSPCRCCCGIIVDGILADTGLVVGIAGIGRRASPCSTRCSTFAQRWFSARIGEGLIYDLRTQVFRHVQRQPIAFFTRAQTGSLVSRLNSDVIGAQQALTSTLSSVVSNALTLILVLIAMFYLSWLVTVIALVLLPLFILPAR